MCQSKFGTFALVCLLSFCQPLNNSQNLSSETALSAAQPSSDNFIGEWSLDTKLSAGGLKSEQIKIKPEGSNYRFTIHKLVEGGAEVNYWFVTPMNGKCVPYTRADGQPMPGKGCFTRYDSNTFKDDNVVLTDKFEVSQDGNTLIIRRNFKVLYKGKKLPELKFFFAKLTAQS